MIYEDEDSQVKDGFNQSFLWFCDYFKEKSEIWNRFYRLEFASFHYKMEGQLLRFFNPEEYLNRQITAIIIARGRGKSKIVPVLYSIWNIFMKNRDHVVLSSEAKGAKSVDNLNDIITLIEDPAFKEIFPWEKGIWQASGGFIEIIYEGRHILIRGIGIEGAILGATWKAARIDLWIGDDLEGPDRASSKEVVDKAENHVNSVILPGMSPDMTDTKYPGQMVLVGTYHGTDCLLARVSKKEWKDLTVVVKYPALVDGPKMAKSLGIKEDHSIWEEKESTGKLHNTRNFYFARGAEQAWYMQYQCKIIASRKKSFHPDLWMEISRAEAQLELAKAKIVCTLDLAYTKGKSSDEVGCTIMAHLPKSRMICLRSSGALMAPEECYEMCLEIKKEYREVDIYGDRNVLPYINALFEKMNETMGAALGIKVEILPLRIDDSKFRSSEAMIEGMRGWYNTNMIRFVKDACKDLYAQAMRWEGIKTKGDAKWDVLESFGEQVLFLDLGKLEEDYDDENKWKSVENMTVGEHAAIYFKDQENPSPDSEYPPNFFTED